MMISASTAIGSRSVNADAFSTSAAVPVGSTIPPTQLPLHGGPYYFAVCDGVGAEEGQTASRRAIEGLQKCWDLIPEQDKQELALPELAQQLAYGGREKLINSGLATTLALVVVRGRAYVSLNVGDSPIFLRRGSATLELSVRDNAYFWKKSLGIEKPPEADARFLLADLSTARENSLHIKGGGLLLGDTLLLCSDGVVGVADPVWGETAEAMVRSAASREPHADNSTAIMIQYTEV